MAFPSILVAPMAAAVREKDLAPFGRDRGVRSARVAPRPKGKFRRETDEEGAGVPRRARGTATADVDALRMDKGGQKDKLSREGDIGAPREILEKGCRRAAAEILQ